MRAKADLDYLSRRREGLVGKFAQKNLNNIRCREWFRKRDRPRYARRENVPYPIYQEYSARTDRHKNTPKNYLVRKLNQAQ